MKNLLTASLFLFSLPVFCQNYTVSGIIKDKNQVTIPMVGIFTKTGQGTCTNDLGEFTLKVSVLPARIRVSHLSYQAVEVEIVSEKPVTIVLEESIKTLPEATVGNYAFELLKKAMDKIADDSVYNHFARGFYRKIQKEGNKYTVLHEMLFNANINGKYGVSVWQPTASRYTLHDGNVENRGTMISSIRNSSASPRVQFLSESAEPIPSVDISKLYRFEVENFIDENTPNEIAVVACSPKKLLETGFSGRFYVKTASNTVLKVTGRRGLTKKYWPSNFWFKVKESYLDMDINYREEDGASVLSGMNLDFVTMVQYAASVSKKVVDHVDLVMYEYGEPKEGELQKLADTIAGETQIFSTTQESPDFWANNAIIKRTPIEDGVIKIFENRKKKGGTMFPSK